MPAKRLGWNLFWGVSNTTITNGLCAPEHSRKKDGGDGTLVADIDVFVPELTPNADGKNMAARNVYDVALLNPLTGQPEKREVTFTSIIRCKYLGRPNEAVPCVYKGEQVWVLQHEGGEFSYYWLPIGRDEGIRNREHLRWFAHDIPKIEVLENGTRFVVSDKNTYFIDICTNRLTTKEVGQDGKVIYRDKKTGEIVPEEGTGKLFQIHTANSDGETFTYDIRIFPEREVIEICDNADVDRNSSNASGGGISGGNRIELDSRNTRITLRNIENSFVRLDKQNITLSCLDTINITAGKKVRIRGGWYDDYKTNRETPLAALSGIVDLITGIHTETQQSMTETTNVERKEMIGKDTLTVKTTRDVGVGSKMSVTTPLIDLKANVNQLGTFNIVGMNGPALNITGGMPSFICTGWAVINGVRVPV